MSTARDGLLARAVGFFVEPGPAVLVKPPAPARSAPVAVTPRPLVVVCSVRPGCGATTIARALAAELATRDPLRSAVVTGSDARGALPLGTPAAARLARLVTERTGAEARPSGRLCLAREAEPPLLERALRGAASLVLDVGPRGQASAAASLADHVVLVAEPATEPALAEILADSLGRVGPTPSIVLNRAPSEQGPAATAADRLRAPPVGNWAGRAHIVVPSSVPGARLALGCRGAGGSFGTAIAALAESCMQP